MPHRLPHKGTLTARSIEEAMERVAALPAPLPEVHACPLVEALGRVLAQDLVAPFSLPGFRRSRYDGFAVRRADCEGACAGHPVRLALTQSVAAGSWPDLPQAPMTCTRIMTGAPVPEGADAIVPFEWVAAQDATGIVLDAPAVAERGVVAADVDAREGDIVLAKGTRIEAVDLGRMAMFGLTRIGVFARPRVAVLSTGSELVLPGTPLGRGKIHNSCQPTICGLLWQAGALPLSCGIAPDDPDVIARTIVPAMADNALIVITGGVGPGDYDLVPEALRRAGVDILVTGEDFHPGGNFVAGSLAGRLVLALSGSPASALLALHFLGLPHIRRLTHATCWRPPTCRALLGPTPVRPTHGLLPGKLVAGDGRLLFDPMRLGEVSHAMPDAILPLQGDEPLEEWRLRGEPLLVYPTLDPAR